MTTDIAGRILVVDDEEGIRDGCRRVLEAEHYHVDTAASGKEGLLKLRAKPFDLVLLDVVMPDVRGMDLLAPIHEVDPEIVCVVITGYATLELAVQAIKAGAYDFLAKPFTTEVLLMTVGQGLERRRLAQEAGRLKAVEQRAAELAQAKEELERLDRFKSEFMLTVAHELRSPLSAIQSFLLALHEGYFQGKQQELVLERIIQRGQGLLESVNDLLRIAAVKSEGQVWNSGVVSLADVLEKVSVLHALQAVEKGLEYLVEIRHRPKVVADSDRMTQLWDNLISNAIRYTPAGGQVRVTLEQQHGWAVGMVEDTGIGIAPDEQGSIFEEFYRTPRARTMEPHGTGLGLTLVKSIVECYGGTIELNSVPDQGSRFTFRLPVSGPEDADDRSRDY